MCDPISIGLAVVSTAVSVVGQAQAAKAQAKAINQQLAVQQKQIDDKASAELNDRLRAQRREQGRILVAAGEAGLSLDSGNVETMLMDSYQQASLSNERSLANRESQRDAAAADAKAAMSQISMPTPLGAGLQIALAGANAAVKARNASKKTS